jgi:hypothetical protein
MYHCATYVQLYVQSTFAADIDINACFLMQSGRDVMLSCIYASRSRQVKVDIVDDGETRSLRLCAHYIYDREITFVLELRQYSNVVNERCYNYNCSLRRLALLTDVSA